MTNSLDEQRANVITSYQNLTSCSESTSYEEMVSLQQQFSLALQEMSRLTQEIESPPEEVIFQSGEISDREVTIENLTEIAIHYAEVTAANTNSQSAQQHDAMTQVPVHQPAEDDRPTNIDDEEVSRRPGCQ